MAKKKQVELPEVKRNTWGAALYLESKGIQVRSRNRAYLLNSDLENVISPEERLDILQY